VDKTNPLLNNPKLTFKKQQVFAKNFFAYFTGEGHIVGLLKLVIAHFVVAICALEPFFATLCSNGNLNI
jgi:hypothetical protein